MHNLRLIAATMILLVPFAGLAKAQEPLVKPDNAIEAARKQMRTDLKLVLAGELRLISDESKAFWPLYKEYEADMIKIGDERVKMIEEYAENFENITSGYADHMLNQYFDIEKRLLKTQK